MALPVSILGFVSAVSSAIAEESLSHQDKEGAQNLVLMQSTVTEAFAMNV